MFLLDAVFLGWYQILDKTIYMYKSENSGIGPKEHSFFISFLLHGINIYTLLRYLFVEYLGENVELSLSISMALIVFFVGYFIYYRHGRAKKVVASGTPLVKTIISLILTIFYTVISIYLMLHVGSYVRNVLHPDGTNF